MGSRICASVERMRAEGVGDFGKDDERKRTVTRT